MNNETAGATDSSRGESEILDEIQQNIRWAQRTLHEARGPQFLYCALSLLDDLRLKLIERHEAAISNYERVLEALRK